jgi:presenilin-like A22 family membrane protease
MFALILVGTGLLLFLIKLKFELVKVLENVVLFLLISTTFSYFLPMIFSFLFASILILISEIRQSFILKNLCLFLSISSASAIIGASLSYKVLILLFLILTFYDIISVFFTKHMVYIAEKLLSKPTAFISVFPSNKIRRISFLKGKKKIKVVALGAGDYFMPASFSVSILEIGIVNSLVVLLSNTLMLFFLFYLLQRKEFSRPLPAIPFLSLSSISGFIISFYL